MTNTSTAGFYQTHRLCGLNYGPRFRSINAAYTQTAAEMVLVQLTSASDSWETLCYIHPAIIDAGCQDGSSRGHIEIRSLSTRVAAIKN